MANQASNHCKYLLATGAINFASDAFKIILMSSGFIFDPDADALYADVVADELPTGFGYTRLTKALAGVVITEDDLDNRAEIVWNSVSWTAVAGAIGPTGGAIIIDDTVAADPVIGFIDFGAEFTQADGGVMTLSAIEVRIS